MAARSTRPFIQRRERDFWMYWAGQVISNLGGSFTGFALPLLIFKLTGSAVNLALAIAADLLPYLFFGLLVGAWVDRVDRKHLMIVTDLLRAMVIALLPLLAVLGLLSVWWIYATTFVSATLSMCFDAASFAALPNLVDRGDLVTANGRLAASYSFVNVIGPLLAAVLLVVIPLPALLWGDALSFLISAGSLALIARSFNAAPAEERQPTSIRQDITEGLRYVLVHPVLRWLTFMLVLINFVWPTIPTQLVFFAKHVLAASDAQLGLLYASGSMGVVVASLVAGRLSKRWSFSFVALGALMVQGLLTVFLAFTPWYWAALPLWALNGSMGILFNINAYSLGQAIVPDHLLGRVLGFVRVLTWSTTPLGAFIGGVAIERTKNVSLVYGCVGMLVFLIALAFAFTPLGHVERTLSSEEIPLI